MNPVLRLLRAFALAALLCAAIGLPAMAFAHEHREVGSYEIVIGWMNEPAFVNEKNGLSLRVVLLDGELPVEGLEQTLQAEIIFGGETRALKLRPLFRQPGAYASDIVPTREGDYRFRIFGTIEGTQIDETFDSADGKFNGVESISAIQFPDAQPSAGELSTTVAAANQRVAEAERAAASARSLGLIGTALGALGLFAGAAALVSARRRPAAPDAQLVLDERTGD